MEINRESFEAWLFAQSPARQFNYLSNGDCIVCMFLKETTNLQNISVQPTLIYYGKKMFENESPMPSWLDSLDGNFSDKKLLAVGLLEAKSPDKGGIIITFGSVQQRYIKLFGNPFPTLASTHSSTQQSINTTHQNEPNKLSQYQEAIS